MTLNLELNEQQMKQLKEIAQNLNVTVTELAMTAISDLIMRSESDFERAAQRVLTKNKELYNRLA
jgi:uncharacterized protein YpuA (DUF1002 family)